eukprot:4479854-Pyramimonas_sp.AAC.1
MGELHSTLCDMVLFSETRTPAGILDLEDGHKSIRILPAAARQVPLFLFTVATSPISSVSA